MTHQISPHGMRFCGHWTRKLVAICNDFATFKNIAPAEVKHHFFDVIAAKAPSDEPKDPQGGAQGDPWGPRVPNN